MDAVAAVIVTVAQAVGAQTRREGAANEEALRVQSAEAVRAEAPIKGIDETKPGFILVM